MQRLLVVLIILPACVLAVDPPDFDHQRGWYDTAFELTLTAPPGASLRYTTDGSRPSADQGIAAGASVGLPIAASTVVRAVAIDNGLLSPVCTHTYLFVSSVLAQDDTAAGTTSDDAVKTAMDQGLVNGNEAAIEDGLKQLPVLAISGSADDLFGDPGVLRGQGYDLTILERVRAAVALEYVEPASTRSWQVDCGLEQAGQGSTSLFKKTLELHFGSTYGPKRLTEPLFDEDPERPVDALRLRLGGSTIENAFTQFGQQWVDDLQRQMSGYGQRGRFVQVFINGAYWGRYNAVERADPDYAAHTFGGDDGHWDHIRRGWEWDGQLVDWFRLKGLHDFDQATNWQAVQELLALEAYVDYRILCSFWELEYDMLREHRFLHNPHTGQGFLPVLWDTDWTLRRLVQDATRPPLLTVDAGRDDILSRLWANAEFRLLMADRIHAHLYSDGALTSGALADSFARRADAVAGTFLGDRARWQDDEYEGLEQDFPGNRAAIEDDLIPDRPALLRQHLRDEGLYPAIDAPGIDTASGPLSLPTTVTLTNSNGSGTLYFTTDGSDPRDPGSAEPIASAQASDAASVSLTVPDSLHLRARVRSGGVWSALAQASYRAADQDDSALVISELLYHPAPPPTLGEAGWRVTYADTYNERTNNALAFNDVVGISLQQHSEAVTSTIDLSWNAGGGPVGGLDGDTAAIMWSATLRPPADETVTLRLQSAGWMALWVDGVRVIDGWPDPDNAGGDGSLRELSAEVALHAGGPHSISVLYAHHDEAVARSVRCTWQRPGRAAEQIPSEFLRSAAFIPQDDGEFIELLNQGTRPLTIGGYRFADGIDARLPPHLVLAPGARWVLGDNPRLFAERYGQQPDQTFAGALANDGERLALHDDGGALVWEWTYDDEAPWPIAADGSGASLVYLGGDASDPANWTSATPSPGTAAIAFRRIALAVAPDSGTEASLDGQPPVPLPAVFQSGSITADHILELFLLGGGG